MWDWTLIHKQRRHISKFYVNYGKPLFSLNLPVWAESFYFSMHKKTQLNYKAACTDSRFGPFCNNYRRNFGISFKNYYNLLAAKFKIKIEEANE